MLLDKKMRSLKDKQLDEARTLAEQNKKALKARKEKERGKKKVELKERNKQENEK